jgi:uncharacterized protein YjgD (DUF1641 family)
MAKPIELMPVPRDAREELKRRVENAPVEHAAAVLAAYELLQELHESGTLDALRGAFGAGGEIVKHASGLAAKPESIHAMRNLLILGNLLGSIDPEMLHRMVDGLPAAAEQAPEEPPSLFQIFRRMRSRNVRRALGAATNVLESAGRGLGPKSN